MKTSFASLIAFLCGVFPAFGQREAAFHARFDGTLDVNGAPPVKTANLTFSDGVDGQAVYVPTNGWLEYSFSSDYLKSESGTVLFWAKTDWAYTGCCTYRDHALTDDGIWGDLRASQLNRSFFLLGSWRGIRLSTSSTFECWYVEAWGGAGTRGRIQPDEWHQYALSFDRQSGRFRAYIDGHLLGDKLFPKPVEGIFPKTFTVGCGGERGGNLGPRLGLSGAMDELRLYPCELTPDEVLADYTRHVPYRMELLDWTVGEDETRKVRLRVRNITTAPITRTFAFNTGDTVSLTLSPDELKEFSVTVRGEKPGLFALECNKGKSDYRQFKMDCLAVIQPSTLNPQPSTLLCEYDCTQDYPTNVFNECGSEIVVDSPCGAYREGKIFNPGTGFLYRFDIRNKGRPHRLEIDYPDDAKREFSFGVWPENYGRLYTGSLDCGGILTGVDHPLTMKMQTKSIVFWPDSDTISAGILAYKPIDGSRPPAVSRVRLYELGDLPSAPNAGAAKDRRSVGVWDEDPTMDAQLVLTHAVNYKDADLEFWREKWQRTIDYMRYEGLDTWVIKALSYYGDVTDMQATFGHTSSILTSDGRCPGWAEIGADMLDRAGMDVWIRYNHKCECGDWIGPLGGGGSTTNYYFEGADGYAPESYGKVNFLRPEIRLAMKRILRAYRDKFKVYGHFRGITMNEAPAPYFDSIKIGYDDWTCSLFARETGMKGMPSTAAERYEFLVGDMGRRATWIQWRCAKVTELARELVDALRDDGGSYELQFWVSPSVFRSREADWFGWDPDESLRRCGVDLRALAAIPGLRVVPMVRPDYFRAHGLYDANEPHFPYHASYQGLLKASGVSEMNVIRHSNLEIYPSMTATSNMWLRPFWLTTGNNTGGVPNFYDYPTPHPDSDQALVSTVQLVADYDVQDLLHGFWGLPESGEHERFRALYSQLRAIPRGRFDLLAGFSNEPVAVRVGETGFYLVNREPYEVTVSWTRNGTRESAVLGNCEIRYFPGDGAGTAVSDVTCEIPSDEHDALDERLAIVEAYAALNPSDRSLQDVADRARAAFTNGLFTTARGLLLSAPAREAILASQGLKVLRAGEPRLVWAHEWDVEDKTLPCHWVDSDWYQVGDTAEIRAEKKQRLGTNKVSVVYTLSHDRVRGGLHLFARVAGGTPDSLTFTFDPKGDSHYDEAGFSPDDVSYVFTEAGPLEGGYVGYEGFIPYSDLKGFELSAGAELAYTFVYRAIAEDENGAFPVSIGPDKYGCKLRLSACRPGATVTLSAKSGTWAASAVVEDEPRELTLAFTPTADATINFGAGVSWAGTARLVDLKVAGAETPILNVPCDLVSGRQSLSVYIKVKAGVPVTVVATIAPREEWQVFDEPDKFVDAVYSRTCASFVDTGVIPKSGTRVELDFAFLDANPDHDPSHLNVVAGAKNAAGQEVRAAGYHYGVRAYVGNGRFSGMTDFKGEMARYKTVTTFVSGDNTYVEDGVRLEDPPDEKWHSYFNKFSVPDCTGVPLYLFAANANGTPTNFVRLALYGAKIWTKEDGDWALKRDYRPCVKAGRAGLYDAVTRTVAYSGSSDDLVAPVRHVVYPETVGGLTPGRQVIAAVREAVPGDSILFTRGTYTFGDDEYVSMSGDDKIRLVVNVRNLSFVGEEMTPRKTWPEGAEPVLVNVNGGRFALVKAKGVTFAGLAFTGADQRRAWATAGGVIGHEGGESVSSNCVFRGNSAWRGGACGGAGGSYHDCLFKDNRARVNVNQSSGGAIYIAEAVKDCDFAGNEAQGVGALENAKRVDNCTFTANVGWHNGYNCAAVKVSALRADIQNCLFEANTNMADKTGGILRFEAASCEEAVANGYGLLVSNCTFRANYVKGHNGLPRGTAVRSLESCDTNSKRMRALLVCEDCAFTDNYGQNGFSGAAFGITARRCTFRDNFTDDNPGVGYIYGDSAQGCDLYDCDLSGGGEIADCSLTRCTLHDITSRGVFWAYSSGPCHMTNCLIRGCSPSQAVFREQKGGTVANCTVVSNTWGAYCYYDCTQATNVNSVFWGNCDADGNACAANAWCYKKANVETVLFASCAFGPGKAAYYSQSPYRPARLSCDADCFDVEDPKFNAGYDPARPYYEPRIDSPLKNAGDNTLVGFTGDDIDLAGNPRLNGLLDIGCYESGMKGFIIIYK